MNLFSHIIDARVYIDEEFIGYTTRDPKVPFSIKLTPGKHSVRVHLTKDFGVINLPEITFLDWQEQINILPGESIVLEDQTKHFNDLLYDIKKLLRETIKIDLGSGEESKISHYGEFIDREGNEVKLNISILFKETNTPRPGGSVEVTFRYQDEDYSFTYFSPVGKDTDFSEKIGLVRLDFDLNCNSSYKLELNYSIWRTDVWQGMHRE